MSSNTQPVPTTRLGFDPGYLTAFEDKLFIEGPQTARRLVNFFVLLLLATVIATYGVLSNSTATVIGAMIVAPLMTPIMATTSAVVMGSLQRTLRGFALTMAGVLSVIFFAYFLALGVPDLTISFTNNGEIVSRINPGIYALLTALGAGAAGAFILSRAEIADSMGGVAIAISLVPPLCVVGISLQQGQLLAAGGAFLLFLTNYLAILLAGGTVLTVLGLGKLGAGQQDTRIRRRGFIVFTVAILLVSIPLTASAYQSVINAVETNSAQSQVTEWLEGTSYEVVSVTVDDSLIITTVEGLGNLNSLNQLRDQLSQTLKRPVLIKLRVIQAQTSGNESP